MQTLPTLPLQSPTPLDPKEYYPEQHPAQGRVRRSIAPPDRPRGNIPISKQFYLGGFTGHSSKEDLKPGNYNGVIHGWSVTAPKADASPEERIKRIGDYAYRVNWKIKDTASGSKGERNVKFQDVRQFMEPAGYFSAGLLAGGYDPHQKITVTFNTYVGVGTPQTLTNSAQRTYFAWEIAAGALEHDKVQRGGPITFNFMEINPNDQRKIDDLESVGKMLQNRWEHEISTPMRDPSGPLAALSGEADAYVVRGTLQSLRSDAQSFKNLSPEGQAAVARTLDNNEQVIIPNVYGYPLSGYAFIAYTRYDGDYEKRPNQGLMLDLKNGAVREIHGDADFASWAKDNHGNLRRSFNLRDVQGGKDSHWPSAAYVLDTLISGAKAHFPGYHNLVSDEEIPVAQLFNYTRARGSDYQLKFGNLYSGVATHYQEVNAKNAFWADRTQVFGSSQQDWKTAKDFWSSTFAYVPVIGNAGNIVFGVHDSIYGMTEQDRVGGSAAAVISSLQLAHELAPGAVESGLGESAKVSGAPKTPRAEDYRWGQNSQTSDFEFMHAAEPTKSTDEVTVAAKGQPANPLRPSHAGHISPYAVSNGEQLIENAHRNAKGIYQVKAPVTGVDSWFIRHTDEQGIPGVYEIKNDFKLSNDYVQIIDPATRKPVMTVNSAGDGEWVRATGEGGFKFPGFRASTAPIPSPETTPNLTPKFTDLFTPIDETAASGATGFDEVLSVDEATHYNVSANGYEEDGVLKRKLNLSWKTRTEKFEVLPSEKAGPTDYSTSHYSDNFIKDVNRNDYAVVKQAKDGEVIFKLDAGGGSPEAIQQNRIAQFEQQIPDEDLRSTMSEVAHQGSVFPANAELLKTLKEGYGAKVVNTEYFLDYDPIQKEHAVRVVAKWYINDLTGNDPRVVPDLEVTTTRTFTIRESNDVLGERFTIDENAPTVMQASLPSAFPQPPAR